MHIVAIVNQKGGVGKTTTAINLSTCVAERGKKVLLMDIDPQGNATSGLSVSATEAQTIYDVLIQGVPIQKVIRPTVVKNLHICPANIDMAGGEVELVSIEARESRLKNAIEEIEGNYDYVFIDCPPSLGLITLNAFAAADGVLVPIQCEYYALEGLGQLVNSIKMVQRAINPELVIEGVLLTMYDSRTKLSEQVADEVRKHFSEKVFKTVIPRNIRLSEAPSHGLPISVYDPLSKGARTYKKLAKEFLENDKKNRR